LNTRDEKLASKKNEDERRFKKEPGAKLRCWAGEKTKRGERSRWHGAALVMLAKGGGRGGGCGTAERETSRRVGNGGIVPTRAKRTDHRQSRLEINRT